jgi:prophage maintenance system killer protein
MLREKARSLAKLQKAVSLISSAAGTGMEAELLGIISDYSRSLDILQGYDDMDLKSGGKSKPVYRFTQEDAVYVIKKAKEEYSKHTKTSELFGAGPAEKLKSIIGAVNQTFDGRELYPTTEEKAAHLLYFAVKGHPFTDGNKRLAAILFLHYMSKNALLYKKDGEKRVSDGALAALTLLAAVSNPREKETMINVITNAIK